MSQAIFLSQPTVRVDHFLECDAGPMIAIDGNTVGSSIPVMTMPGFPKPLCIAAALLTLSSAVCVMAAGFRAGECQDRLASETEKAEQRPELDDLDDLEAIVDPEVSLHSDLTRCELLETHPDCPLLTHTWRWCSRGPPVA